MTMKPPAMKTLVWEMYRAGLLSPHVAFGFA